MRAKAKPQQDKPLKISMGFDTAIKRAVKVKPPPEGWAKYEKKLAAQRKRRRSKSAA